MVELLVLLVLVFLISGAQAAKQRMRDLKFKVNAMEDKHVVSELQTMYLEIHAVEPINTCEFTIGAYLAEGRME